MGRRGRGAAPKIHIRMGSGAADVPADHAVSTAGERPMAAFREAEDALGLTAPASRAADVADPGARRGLSY